MARLYTFYGQNKADIIGLNAQNIVWIEEVEPLREAGDKEIQLLKAVSHKTGYETIVRATLNHLVPMEDFRYWLSLTLPSGKTVQVNPEKIEDLQHRPGGTDIIFEKHPESVEAQMLFVAETPVQILEQINFDPMEGFSELMAQAEINRARMFSKYGISPEGAGPLDTPEPA